MFKMGSIVYKEGSPQMYMFEGDEDVYLPYTVGRNRGFGDIGWLE